MLNLIIIDIAIQLNNEKRASVYPTKKKTVIGLSTYMYESIVDKFLLTDNLVIVFIPKNKEINPKVIDNVIADM